MRIEGNCKYGEALSSATNIRKIIFRPKSGRKFSCRFFISQGIAGEAPGELHGYCMMHAVFADKETVCLDCVPMTVYVLVSERKRGEIGWPANSQLPD